MVYQHFLDFIRAHDLFGRDNRILLGVSGGIDSVVMLHLFIRAGYPVGIAHCNYRLRGAESDRDEAFVRELAGRYELPFYGKQFDTHDYARKHKLSVQMAARRLRYRWFNELQSSEGFDVVAIGHNKDDQCETFLINLARGTGLKGLTGMKVKTGVFVRPLLFASRGQIEAYCHQQSIPYREDSTNPTTQYHRNKIRHQVLPVFLQLNPRFLDTMMENIERLGEAYDIYTMAVEEIKSRFVHQQGDDTYISKSIKQIGPYRTLLYEILREYHFNRDTIQEIAGGIGGESGKEFFSPTHKLVRDRDRLILTGRFAEQEERHYIEAGQQTIGYPLSLQLKVIERSRDYEIPAHPDIAAIDYDKVAFPLILRKWHEGDYFKPLGMNHFKKLSDFFVDRKYSRLDKERIWLLASGEKIIWIIGDRLDERFRIDEGTCRILEVRFFR